MAVPKWMAESMPFQFYFEMESDGESIGVLPFLAVSRPKPAIKHNL